MTKQDYILTHKAIQMMIVKGFTDTPEMLHLWYEKPHWVVSAAENMNLSCLKLIQEQYNVIKFISAIEVSDSEFQTFKCMEALNKLAEAFAAIPVKIWEGFKK